MTSLCTAIRIASATDYGHSDWDTGTVAYQCEKNATQGKFCGVCSKHKGAFGKIGCSYTWEDGTESTVPEYALKDGAMEDGTKVDKGDAMCWVFANPLMDEDGNLLAKDGESLDDEYWQCDDEDDQYDDEGDWTDDDADDEADDEDDEDDDDDDSTSDDYKGIKVPELRTDLEERNLSTKGKKADLVSRLVNNDNGSDEEDAPKKSKADKKPRKPSAYNLYMKSAIKKYKSKNPDTEHQTAFKACAAQWTKSKDKKGKTAKA